MNSQKKQEILRFFFKFCFIYLPAILFYYSSYKALTFTNTIDLGMGFHFNLGNRSIYSRDFSIPGMIENYKYNNRYIIVRQKPDNNYPAETIKYMYPRGKGKLYYWIIDKEENCKYGPLTPYDFAKKLDSIDIDLHFDKFRMF